MRSGHFVFLLCSTVAALNCTNGTVKQDFRERFTVYTGSCVFDGCPEDLTHPVDALSWTNVLSVRRIVPLDFIRPGGQVPPYVINDPTGHVVGPGGLWTGQAINATKSTVATAKYNGSCVDYWLLNTITLGCDITTTGVGTGPRDCNITVEGFDSKGQCVGQEKFSYHGDVVTTGFPPYWLEQDYNTTEGGLKGKRLTSISILADIPYDPSIEDTPELGIGEMLYTVYNGTTCGCPGGSNSTAHARRAAMLDLSR